jgi:hypothetical protein
VAVAVPQVTPQVRRAQNVMPVELLPSCLPGNTEPCVDQRPSPLRRTPRRSPANRQRPELQPLIDHLREVAQGRDDIRTECAGVIAGSWFASGVRRGEELIAAGLLMLAGPIDLDELDQWMRVGWERRRGTDVPYGPTS